MSHMKHSLNKSRLKLIALNLTIIAIMVMSPLSIGINASGNTLPIEITNIDVNSDDQLWQASQQLETNGEVSWVNYDHRVSQFSAGENYDVRSKNSISMKDGYSRYQNQETTEGVSMGDSPLVFPHTINRIRQQKIFAIQNSPTTNPIEVVSELIYDQKLETGSSDNLVFHLIAIPIISENEGSVLQFKEFQHVLNIFDRWTAQTSDISVILVGKHASLSTIMEYFAVSQYRSEIKEMTTTIIGKTSIDTGNLLMLDEEISYYALEKKLGRFTDTVSKLKDLILITPNLSEQEWMTYFTDRRVNIHQFDFREYLDENLLLQLEEFYLGGIYQLQNKEESQTVNLYNEDTKESKTVYITVTQTQYLQTTKIRENDYTGDSYSLLKTSKLSSVNKGGQSLSVVSPHVDTSNVNYNFGLVDWNAVMDTIFQAYDDAKSEVRSWIHDILPNFWPLHIADHAWSFVENTIFKASDVIVNFAKNYKSEIASALAVLEGVVAFAMSGFAIVAYYLHKLASSLDKYFNVSGLITWFLNQIDSSGNLTTIYNKIKEEVEALVTGLYSFTAGRFISKIEELSFLADAIFNLPTLFGEITQDLTKYLLDTAMTVGNGLGITEFVWDNIGKGLTNLVYLEQVQALENVGIDHETAIRMAYDYGKSASYVAQEITIEQEYSRMLTRAFNTVNATTTNTTIASLNSFDSKSNPITVSNILGPTVGYPDTRLNALDENGNRDLTHRIFIITSYVGSRLYGTSDTEINPVTGDVVETSDYDFVVKIVKVKLKDDNSGEIETKPQTIDLEGGGTTTVEAPVIAQLSHTELRNVGQYVSEKAKALDTEIIDYANRNNIDPDLIKESSLQVSTISPAGTNYWTNDANGKMDTSFSRSLKLNNKPLSKIRATVRHLFGLSHQGLLIFQGMAQSDSDAGFRIDSGEGLTTDIDAVKTMASDLLTNGYILGIDTYINHKKGYLQQTITSNNPSYVDQVTMELTEEGKHLVAETQAEIDLAIEQKSKVLASYDSSGKISSDVLIQRIANAMTIEYTNDLLVLLQDNKPRTVNGKTYPPNVEIDPNTGEVLAISTRAIKRMGMLMMNAMITSVVANNPNMLDIIKAHELNHWDLLSDPTFNAAMENSASLKMVEALMLLKQNFGKFTDGRLEFGRSSGVADSGIKDLKSRLHQTLDYFTNGILNKISTIVTANPNIPTDSYNTKFKVAERYIATMFQAESGDFSNSRFNAFAKIFFANFDISGFSDFSSDLRVNTDLTINISSVNSLSAVTETPSSFSAFKKKYINTHQKSFVGSLKGLSLNSVGASIGNTFLSTFYLFVAEVFSSILTYNVVMFLIAQEYNIDFQDLKNGLIALPTDAILSLNQMFNSDLTIFISIMAVIMGSFGDALDILVGDVGELGATILSSMFDSLLSVLEFLGVTIVRYNTQTYAWIVDLIAQIINYGTIAVAAILSVMSGGLTGLIGFIINLGLSVLSGMFIQFLLSNPDVDWSTMDETYLQDPETILLNYPIEVDSDFDGLSDSEEASLGTNPNSTDTDDDSLWDYEEVYEYKTNPLTNDSDGDGLVDYDEIKSYGTNATNPDTDGDGLWDDVELGVYNVTFVTGGHTITSYLATSDPTKFDTDGDQINDFDEVMIHKTAPNRNDTDGDGLYDIIEINFALSDPLDQDTDNDTLSDGFEYSRGTNVTSVDTDKDGLNDDYEINILSDPISDDSDLDGLLDGDEVNIHKTSPLFRDSDFDGLNDTYEMYIYNTNPIKYDTDEDGLSDGFEYNRGTDPLHNDTDRDGVLDGLEVHIYQSDPININSDTDTLNDSLEIFILGSSPIHYDTDNDGLRDDEEYYIFNTNVTNADTDEDGLEDGLDYSLGMDPLNPDIDDDGLPDGLEHYGWTVNGTYYKSDAFLNDTDSDTLLDNIEYALGTDPRSTDTDNDRLLDAFEVNGIDFTINNTDYYGITTNPANNDTDFDGLLDGDEYYDHFTHPVIADIDGDFLVDGLEILHNTDPFVADLDPDIDGLDNELEISYGTDPYLSDTDNDMLNDYTEIFNVETNPTNPDTDDDGLSDGEEVLIYNTLPKTNDTDGDLLLDGQEVNTYTTNPRNPDSDYDLLTDYEEIIVHGTLPKDPDSDNDGLWDGLEISHNTDPYNKDTDGDLLFDGPEVSHGTDPLVAESDPDDDELTNYDEINIHLTDPFQNDTDNDHLRDDAEIFIHGTDPNDSDTDDDLINDGMEINGFETYIYGNPFFIYTNALDNDTDGDYLIDGKEVLHQTDPLVIETDPDEDAVLNYDEIYTYSTDPFNNDTDSDGLSDHAEIYTHLTKPNDWDTDDDDLSDGEEILEYGTDPFELDTDGDGLGDGSEVLGVKTNPLLNDTDGDLLLDGDEVDYNTNPLFAELDPDDDGIENYDEINIHLTSPFLNDTDNDGLSDDAEIFTHLTNPIKSDSDDDGLNDYSEIFEYPTNPLINDTDGDGLTDGDEINGFEAYIYGVLLFRNTNATNSDTDGDLLIDGDEVLYQTDPTEFEGDVDNDGLENYKEFDLKTDPFLNDTDFDGLLDGVEVDGWYIDTIKFTSNPLTNDTDSDELLDFDEKSYGTNATNPDTDGDGLFDGIEILKGADPFNPDTDGDGLFDGEEVNVHGTDPTKMDTDEDLLNDKDEIDNAISDPTIYESDADNDELSNFLELNTYYTNPFISDTDGDGLDDGPEVFSHNTDPLNVDTDEDDLEDGEEVNTYGTEPLLNDTDSDGLEDGFEVSGWLTLVNGEYVNHSSSPLLENSDSDSYLDLKEWQIGTDPSWYDTDGDGIQDDHEIIGWHPVNNASITYHTLPTNNDTDGDLLLDGKEMTLSTNPHINDTDGDLLLDGLEYLGWNSTVDGITLEFFSDPYVANSDNDTLSDYEEYIANSNPQVADTDGDGLLDHVEVNGWFVILGIIDGHVLQAIYTSNPRINDTDGDQLEDGIEKLIFSNPRSFDTDGDNLGDYEEYHTYGTYPNKSDSDNDGLDDGDEVLIHLTLPLNEDTDGDGLLDGIEVNGWDVWYPPYSNPVHYTSEPNNTDTDMDGLNDSGEKLWSTNPRTVDYDGDGLWDGIEVTPWTIYVQKYGWSGYVQVSSHPRMTDTDGDGLTDAEEKNTYGTNPSSSDTDGDGLVDNIEITNWSWYRSCSLWCSYYYRSTYPRDYDSDNDGLIDGDEYAADSDARDSDSDDDGVGDYDEVKAYYTNPRAYDTDGDGWGDWYEIILYGTSPLRKNTESWDFESGHPPGDYGRYSDMTWYWSQFAPKNGVWGLQAVGGAAVYEAAVLDFEVKDGYVEGWVKPVSNSYQTSGLMVRVTDSSSSMPNGYYVRLYRDILRLYKITNGVFTELGSHHMGEYFYTKWWHVKLEAIGPQLKVWISKTSTTHIDDPAITYNIAGDSTRYYIGRVAVVSRGSCCGDTYYDDINVKGYVISDYSDYFYGSKGSEWTKTGSYVSLTEGSYGLEARYTGGGPPSSWVTAGYKKEIGKGVTSIVIQYSYNIINGKMGHLGVTGTNELGQNTFWLAGYYDAWAGTHHRVYTRGYSFDGSGSVTHWVPVYGTSYDAGVGTITITFHPDGSVTLTISGEINLSVTYAEMSATKYIEISTSFHTNYWSSSSYTRIASYREYTYA